MRQLGHHLYNRGQVERAHELFRETSKVHGFMSLFQRPVMSVPDLEAVPVWNAEEQVRKLSQLGLSYLKGVVHKCEVTQYWTIFDPPPSPHCHLILLLRP